jgi:hypothetical protein
MTKGQTGIEVQQVQVMLNLVLSIRITVDGIFGNQTEQAIKMLQSAFKLEATGLFDPITKAKLIEQYTLKTSVKSDSIADLYIPLSPANFVSYKTNKIGITKHHTVSDGNPKTVIRVWNEDQRGAVATHYVLGREMVNGSKEYDGLLVQCLPLDNFAFHVLMQRMGFSDKHNQFINQSYIGFEFCSWGCLDYRGGKFYVLNSEIEVPAYQVCELKTPFRTYKYWHKYTDAQLQRFKKAALDLNKLLGLKLQTDKALNITDWFELSWDAMAARRKLTTHTNFEYGKFDMFPQPELLETIEDIYYNAG